ncbi:MAG: hypothetical protein IKS23_02730, partial [Alphaproteobacteria bacterium]|nr:hypothetical protein [Alphaproteobacteria bacterium]
MLWTTGVSRWKANSKPTFSRIGKRSLEGTLDTSGVSRMVLHNMINICCNKVLNFVKRRVFRALSKVGLK